MGNSPYAPFYDLFKLIVATILLAIFLFLFTWMPFTLIPQSELPSATQNPPHPTSTPVPVISSPTRVPTSIPPTVTTVATSTPLPRPSPTETDTPTQSLTPVPTPTETPASESTVTPPVVDNPPGTIACGAVSRSQLQVGAKATILHRLNFRSSAGIRNNRILTNAPGTQVEIIGGPTCTSYQNGGSYLWWQIRLPDGRVGWSAEASAFGAFYFMEPVQ